MTAEVIEGEARDVTADDSRALVPQAHLGGGAIALLSDDAFTANLELLRKARDRADQVKAALLKDGTDYGSLPGIKRPFLHQPGAETFEKAYGLATSFVIERHVGDGETSPDLEFIAHARIHVGDTAGPVIAEGTGEASSWETKYRYRTIFAKRSCPDCGQATIVKLGPKGERKEAYWCAPREGGCSHSFPAGSPKFIEIDGQKIGGEKVDNPDPWDLANTLVKMACKRAHVAGILRATGTSGLFTQDDDSPAVRREVASAPATARAGPAAPEVAPEPTAAADEAPGAPEGPAGLQGVVSERPDGIRQVRISRPNLSGGPFEKLELRFKVAGRQHTAMLLDGLARAVEELDLQPQEVVRIIGGEVEEVEWQAGKPKKKELWGATGVYVLRTGEWWPAVLSSRALGFGEAGPQASSEPASGPTSSPAATSTPLRASPGPSSSSSSASRRSGEQGAVATLTGRLRQPVEFVSRGERRAAVVKAVDPVTGELINALLGDDPPGEVAAQVGEPGATFFGEGDVVTMLGTWHNGWLVLTAVGRAT